MQKSTASMASDRLQIKKDDNCCKIAQVVGSLDVHKKMVVDV